MPPAGRLTVVKQHQVRAERKVPSGVFKASVQHAAAGLHLHLCTPSPVNNAAISMKCSEKLLLSHQWFRWTVIITRLWTERFVASGGGWLLLWSKGRGAGAGPCRLHAEVSWSETLIPQHSKSCFLKCVPHVSPVSLVLQRINMTTSGWTWSSGGSWLQSLKTRTDGGRSAWKCLRLTWPT